MDIKSACVIHLNQIGDLVFSLPLLRALRDNFPQARIHSVVKPYLRELLEGSPFVDEIKLRKSGLKHTLRLLGDIRRERYDLIICLSRSEACMALTALSGAQTKAGFARFPRGACLDAKEEIRGHNSWSNNAALLKALGVKVVKNDYVGLLPAPAAVPELDLPDRFVVVSPGASRRRLTKTWDQNKFAQVMARLWRQYGLAAVLVGGSDSGETNGVIVEYLEAMDSAAEVLNLTGQLSLRGLCGVLQRACLFVGIDSGIMHLASSLDVPVAGLFGPTDPAFVGPQNRNSVVVREASMACVPCYLKKCGHCACMQHLSVDKVLDACAKLLARDDACCG